MPTCQNSSISRNAEPQRSIGFLYNRHLRPGFFRTMRKIFLHIFWEFGLGVNLLALIMAFSSCEKTDFAGIDISRTPPFLAGPSLSPASVNIDTVGGLEGKYSIFVESSVLVTDPEGPGDVEEAYVEVLRPSAESPFFKAPLSLKVGAGPAGQPSLFSGSIQFDIARDEAGRYRVRFIARNKAGLYGNVLETTLDLRRNNSPPRLSDLSAPDTILLPVGGSLVVSLSVAAADSDGLGDIQQVYFRSLTSSTPDFKFFLFDDGDATPPGPPFFLSSGDAVAGDGRFSVRIPLTDGPNVRRTNIFAFQAVDSFGDTSATVLHSLTVR
jgi:hypothetical protein